MTEDDRKTDSRNATQKSKQEPGEVTAEGVRRKQEDVINVATSFDARSTRCSREFEHKKAAKAI